MIFSPIQDSLSNAISYYDGSEISQRSLTLPRRHHRRNLSSESTFLISSRDCSPIRRRSPAICYGGSLPRSTHSIPGRSPKRTPLNKQIIDEKNRTLAKSGEIYNKSSLTGPNEQPLNQRFQLNRNNYSGPSSLESGKTSSLVTSGPSSIDSGNKSLSLSRNSGHSSLDSAHGSAATVAQTHGSPKNSARHKLIKSSGTSTSKVSAVTTSTSSNGIKSTSFDESSSAMMPNSNSSGSITLQVTNNNNCTGLPNTKIFVQNSPVRTSITFENGKFIENSNVYVINNETTTNSKGEVIASRKTLMSPSSPLKQQNQSTLRRSDKPRSFGNGKENFFSENDEAASETGDSLSMISETSPESSLIPFVDDDIIEPDSRRQNNVQSPESHKYTKNIDESMNNRKLSLQMGSPEKMYNNMLKNHYNQQTNASVSPVIHNNNDKMNLFSYENSPQAGSVGNLKSEKTSCNFLNSNPTINSDSLLNIFHKNIIAVGSEPNLITLNKQYDNSKQKINNCIRESPGVSDEKTPTSEARQEPNGLYSFPSLTDLSFNFTSLHAQKILKGGTSVNNSIDTLVELDISKPINHKSNSNLSPSATICTDFGMV